MIQVLLAGRDGRIVRVLPSGQIAVAPVHFSRPASIKLDVAGQAYNFASAAPGKKFVITEIVLTADKNVTTDALVEVYEASAPDTASVDKTIFKIEMLKNTSIVLTGLHWSVTSGKYLNAKTDDDDVYATIAHYIQDDDADADLSLGVGEDV